MLCASIFARSVNNWFPSALYDVSCRPRDHASPDRSLFAANGCSLIFRYIADDLLDGRCDTNNGSARPVAFMCALISLLLHTFPVTGSLNTSSVRSAADGFATFNAAEVRSARCNAT